MCNSVFGLDFGTTNSSLALNKGGNVRLLEIDRKSRNATAMQSVLYFCDNGDILVGQEAIDGYIEDNCTGRFLKSIKSFLPSELPIMTTIRGRNYELEDLIAIILQRIKISGEQLAGEEVDKVVMGRPVIFSEDRTVDALAESRLLNATLKAGFKHVSFLFEPVAAALVLESNMSPNEERVVLVGDFGGGTSDFTIMRLRGGSTRVERRDDILALGGVYIGGDTFDSRIMWDKITHHLGKDVNYRTIFGQTVGMPKYFMSKLAQWHLIHQLRNREDRGIIREIRKTADDPDAIANLEQLISDNTGILLFQAIEQAKCGLSTEEQATIVFNELKTEIAEDITRVEFERIIAEQLEKIEACVDGVMAKAMLMPEQIDDVFLTGGSSKIPSIRQIFERKFGVGCIRERDALTSVAHGLGVSASLLFK